jgi:DNA-binding MarR family transcriptional regulator
MPPIPSHSPTTRPHQWAENWFDFVGAALCLAKQAQRELARDLADRQIGEAQFLVFWHVNKAGDSGVPQSDLVESLGFSKAQISQQLEKLRREGWILGVRPADDRRCQHWCCTPAGRSVIREISDQGSQRANPPAGLADDFARLSARHAELFPPAALRIHGEERLP